jgi:hypothetical protein
VEPLGARMFDYAFWGIVLALLAVRARSAGFVPDNEAYWLSHPLVAPVIITGTWVCVETLLMASVGTTPGKWLFGCYVQYSISDAYARREMKSQIWRSFKARVPGVVGGHGLRLSADRADPDRDRLREAGGEPRKRLGFRPGLPGDARASRERSTW